MEKSCSKEYTTWGDITGFDSAEVIDYEKQDEGIIVNDNEYDNFFPLFNNYMLTKERS